MNYRHGYHAGNFADVFKHLILVHLLQALRRKEKGFAYIETHAGAGRYDLRADEAGDTEEFRDGVARLWGHGPPAGTEAYLAAVRAMNAGRRLRYYPGSPRIARFFLRPQDRMRLAERAPAVYARLQAEFAGDRHVLAHCGDGYTLLKAWLPPPERRGLVLIDPPYERNDEWARLHEGLRLALKRWAQGIYAVWYPLKAGTPVERFKAQLVQAGLRKILSTELTLWPADSPFRLNGCGMLIVNPPWRLDSELRSALEPLAIRLKQGPTAAARVQWLAPE